MKIDIRGAIIKNDSKWIYDFFGMESTCPADVSNIIDKANGEDLDVNINSSGGDIFAGSEIYTALRGYSGNVNISIVGLAASAASVIAMAGHSKISPTAMVMIHKVSTYAEGNHNALEHQANVLKTADQSIANAYKEKTGLNDERLLELMDHETWMNAQQAVEYGFVDEIMFDLPPTATYANGTIISAEAEQKLRNILKRPEKDNKDVFLMDIAKEKLNLLKIKGGYKNEI